ncbi:MAG: futalosine hydrolase [Phycisphaerales bacterium JB054]
MHHLLDPALADRPCLLAVAAPREVEAVLGSVGAPSRGVPAPWETVECGSRLHVVRTGVGKANAAGAVARALAMHDYAAVLSLGIAGALPHASPLAVGQSLLADPCILADDGLGTAAGFASQSEMGFPTHERLGERFGADPSLGGLLAGVADRIGPCATVSTCSGTDARAREVAARTGALAEDMESAAVGLVAARLGVPFASLRVVSNRTGDRERQGWDLDSALSRLADLASFL